MIITNGERIFNVLGLWFDITRSANTINVLACEYIKQHTLILIN